MTDPQRPKSNENHSSSAASRAPVDKNGDGFLHGPKYPNRPEAEIPDAAALREQWRFATRQYSKWYSHAWGTAILAGAAFFALGWIVKGGNPLPSLQKEERSSSSSDGDGK